MIKKRIQIGCMVIFMIFGLALPTLASSLGGELSANLVYQWDEETKTLVQSQIPTKFSLVLEDSLDSGGKVYFSTQGFWDWKNKKGDLFVDQLWFSGYTDLIDYRLGRQIISWGTADGFNPTNYFARINSAALTSGEIGTEPFWAVQATYYGSNWSATGVMVPFFRPQEIDPLMRKIMTETDPQAPLLLETIDNVKKPSGLGKNSEFALRVESSLAGWDLQASFFSGFESLPGLQTKFDPTVTPVPIRFEGEYRRQYFVGFATAGNFRDAGVWGEVTYGGPSSFEESDNPMESILSVNEKYLQAVIGGDYTIDLGKGLLVQGQYIYRGQGSLFAPYAEEIKPAHYLYGRLSYDFNLESSLELVMIHGLKDHSGLLMPVYTHRFPYSFALEIGLLGVYGADDKEFGPIPSQARISLSYKF